MRTFVAVFAVFLGTAALLRNSTWGEPEIRKPSPLPKSTYDTATVRKLKKQLLFDGYACSGCHADPEKDEPDGWTRDPREKGQFHEAVKLQHGQNTRCFNCHNKRKMDSFADYDGSPIAYAEVEKLCSKCHGPKYRDWKAGEHGRRSGHWDVKAGPRKVETCIACHDPHWPVFKEMTPAPAPRQLHPGAENIH